jgi:hypothetical protein
MSTEILKVEGQEIESVSFFNKAQFETMQRIANVFMNSELVPEIYRASEKNPAPKAIANAMIALEMASRIGASPLMVMQNLYVVYGRPGWSSKFLIATVNTCGKYEPLRFKMTNLGKTKFDKIELDNWQCIAYTNLKGSDEVLESSPVDIAMAVAEGWYGKNGSKWKNMPIKMLRYRAASFWTNEFAPEISMGMHTTDEIEDITYEEIPKGDVAGKVKSEIDKNANKTEIGIDEPPAQTDAPPATQNGAPTEGEKPTANTEGPKQEGDAKEGAGTNGKQMKAPF